MSPNGADGMANSVDPDQTAPLGAVWSGSPLFAQPYLSENSGSLWYFSVSIMLLNAYKTWSSGELIFFHEVIKLEKYFLISEGSLLGSMYGL